MKTKTQSLKDHTKKRLAERYGLNYSKFIKDNLLHQIHSGKGKFVYKQSLRVSVWDCTYDVKETDILNATSKAEKIIIRAVYDKNRKTIITVLSPDMNPRDLENLED